MNSSWRIGKLSKVGRCQLDKEAVVAGNERSVAERMARQWRTRRAPRHTSRGGADR